MADIKTVILTGEEVRVDLGRKHVNIRNLGSSTVYVAIMSGIVPDADGVLGIPAGSTDIVVNTDGYVYIKGSGKVQLAGSDYVDLLLSSQANRSGGSGGSGVPDGSNDVNTSDIDAMFNEG